MSWIDVAGIVFGTVAVAATVLAAVSIFGKGPIALPWPGRPGATAREIVAEVGRGLRIGRPLAGAISGSWQEAEGEETVSGAQSELTVNNVSGPIRVTGWDEETVRIRYVKQARTEADLKSFTIEVSSDARGIEVRPVYGQAGGAGRFGSVEFEISLPRRIERLALHSVSGDIVLSDLPGEVQKELSTISGSISTEGPGDLAAKTTSGAIEFAFSGEALELSSISGRITGSLASLGARGADIGTISGRVELAAYSGLEATLDLRSVSGAIACEFPLTIREQSRGRLTGSIGGGTVPLSIHTTSGAIRIAKK